MSTMTLLTLEQARANRLETDWDTFQIRAPWFIGRRLIDSSIEELTPFIPWGDFFRALDVPADAGSGDAARDLQARARALLDANAGQPRPVARAVYGFWPANSIGDDIVVYRDDSRARELVRFHMLRQQAAVPRNVHNLSLADFVAPLESFAPDYIGAFAIAVAPGVGEASAEDSSLADARVGAALASCLARACAERLHADVHQDWGQAGQDSALRGATGHRGIRVAFGDSAAPDRTENRALFRLLHASDIGLSLDDAGAQTHAAAICGIYLSHPAATAFDVGPIGADQLEDYAARKGVAIDEAARCLAHAVSSS